MTIEKILLQSEFCDILLLLSFRIHFTAFTYNYTYLPEIKGRIFSKTAFNFYPFGSFHKFCFHTFKFLICKIYNLFFSLKKVTKSDVEKCNFRNDSIINCATKIWTSSILQIGS